ncbi:MAG: hypothetical protein ACFFA6_13980, partial [Promethearchaeota archaeon]
LYILFAILIVINFKIRENLKRFILKFAALIAFLLTGTTVFFYAFILFSETLFRFFLPFIFASCYFFIPSTYLYRKKLINVSLGQKLLIGNTFLLTVLLTLIPTFIYLELITLGLTVNLFTVMNVINFTLYILFAILIIINFKIRENLKRFILKFATLIAFLLTGTTVFFYFFIIFSETLFRFFLPFIFASCYFFIPSIYSYRNRLINESIVKKVLSFNTLLMSGLTICLPTIFGKELELLGLSVDYFLISIITILLLFGFSRFYELIAKYFKIKEKYIKALTLLQIFEWLGLSIFISFEIISLSLIPSILILKVLIIECSILTFFILNIYTYKLFQLYSKDLNFLKYLKSILYYGSVISLSFIGFSLIQFSKALNYLPNEMRLFNLFWHLGFFFLIMFLLLKISSSSIHLEFIKIQRIIEFLSWIIAKILVCFFLSFVIILLVQLSLFNLIITFLLIFSILSPITFSYFAKFELVSKEYQLFIKRFIIILFIIDIVSLLSYSWLFNNPLYGSYNIILTTTLTSTITGLVYVLLYNQLPVRLRNLSFFIILLNIVISFPFFLYIFISLSLSIPFGEIFPIIIAIDFGIFLFYLSIGIYQWKISWAIWKTGWFAWFIVPFVNFYLLYRSLRGIDIATRAIDFFGYEINGSFLLTLIISFLFLLPIVYTKIKLYLYQILLVVWGINLALLYWISQNLFVDNIPLRYLIFAIFAAVLLAPIFFKLKLWKTISILWFFLITINGIFLIIFLLALKIPLEIAISIDIFAIATLFLISSFFPAFRSIRYPIIISSYATAIVGIFLTLYFVLVYIILDPIFALNMTFILVGFSLFTSKYIKPIKRLIDLIASWILIFSISWLTFNSLILFPNLLFIAIFLAIAVWGGSFFVFNYFKMKITINKAIPILALSLGISSAYSSFLAIFLAEIPFFIAANFVAINLFFIYMILGNFRLYLWYIFPLPLTFLIHELFLLIDSVRSSFFLATLIFLIDYLIIFQIIMNISNSYFKGAKIRGENKLSYFFKDKNQIKMQNLICFLVNSIYISMLLSLVSSIVFKQIMFKDLIIIYQILNISIILPILFLFCLKYIIKAEIDLKVRNLLLSIHKISLILYLVLPIAVASNLFLLILKLDLKVPISIYLFLIIFSGMIFSGVLFIELFVLDNRYFYYLLVAYRYKLMFWSWLAFWNIFCVFLYVFHLNIYFLLLLISLGNLIDSYFMVYFNIKNKNFESIMRLILIYNSFIWISYYIASLISQGIVLIFEELHGMPSILLFLQNSTFLLLIFSNFIKKIKERMQISIKLLLIILFQIFFAINWVVLFSEFHILNLFTIYFIVLIETCVSFITVKYANILFIKEKFPNFLTKTNSLITFLLYLEACLVIYGYSIEFLGVFESILLSQLTLFALTSLDIVFIGKLRESYGRLVHTISYFIISLATLLILNQFVEYNPLLISIEVFSLLYMQFYTNYSLFLSLSHFYPNEAEKFKNLTLKGYRFIGIMTYLSALTFIIQALFLIRIDAFLLILIVSLFLHELMILDTLNLKFLGNLSIYMKGISWLLFMGSSFLYVTWSYIYYLFDILISLIPPLILILVLELFYLFKLFKFLPVVSSNKGKIRKSLVTILYSDFIIWPLFFSKLDFLLITNLFLLSFVILTIITYVDEQYFQIFKKKSLKNIRFAAFFIILSILSVDIFMGLYYALNLSLPLSLCTSLLIFSIFNIGLSRPYKRAPSTSFTYGGVISLLTSLTIYFASSQISTSIIFFPIALTFYLFIFMLEVLKKFFNKFIDFLLHFFSRLKEFIKQICIKIFNFLKLHIKFIWITFSLLIAISIGTLLSPLQLNYLNWYHSLFVMLGIFGALSLVLPSKKIEDVDLIFKQRMRKLITSWVTLIAITFLFIPPIWYIVALWVS